MARLKLDLSAALWHLLRIVGKSHTSTRALGEEKVKVRRGKQRGRRREGVRRGVRSEKGGGDSEAEVVCGRRRDSQARGKKAKGREQEEAQLLIDGGGLQ